MAQKVLFEIKDAGDKFEFDTTIEKELNQAQLELANLNETIDTIKSLKPECDKLDYSLAVSSGALCGIMDIFLVGGDPVNSPLTALTDNWVDNRVKDFAKLCGWPAKNGDSLASAIRYLENKFAIPYDQHGAGDAGQSIFGLTPTNHHFKSLAHHPSLLGLFFSILDQFTNQSHFVTVGELISLQKADSGFELKGENLLSKLFCAFTNWFGHLVSDVAGSSGSKGRGMGIPSPLWTWTSDIIAIKRTLKIPVSDFNQSMNEIAMKIFTQGYDIRFQVAQSIPVLINELVVRLFYSIRRMLQYFNGYAKEEWIMKNLWNSCEPFSNPTVKRMLTIAHGTFCLIDLSDATIQGMGVGVTAFNPVVFFMRVNIIGIGRFTISLYGETNRRIQLFKHKQPLSTIKQEKILVEYYLEGLQNLADIYDDSDLMIFIKDFSNSQVYQKAFEASIELAEKRKVTPEKILRTKQDIDVYFGGKSK